MKAIVIISLLCLYTGFALNAQELSEKQLRRLETMSDEVKRNEVYKKYRKKDSISSGFGKKRS
ncbi:MAG: hypothetical protein WD555_00175 [Fulvivirga sp.]